MAKAANPLEYISGLSTELGLVTELSDVEKLNYVNAQLDEYRKVIWRNQVDILLSENLIASKDHNLSSKGSENLRNFRFQADQMAEALTTLVKLQSQLAKTVETEE